MGSKKKRKKRLGKQLVSRGDLAIKCRLKRKGARQPLHPIASHGMRKEGPGAGKEEGGEQGGGLTPRGLWGKSGRELTEVWGKKQKRIV